MRRSGRIRAVVAVPDTALSILTSWSPKLCLSCHIPAVGKSKSGPGARVYGFGSSDLGSGCCYCCLGHRTGPYNPRLFGVWGSGLRADRLCILVVP